MATKSLEQKAPTQVPLVARLDPRTGSGPCTPRTALRRCRDAWQRAFDAYMAKHGEGDEVDGYFAARPAGEAYCGAMPLLEGRESILGFIACAAHGILIGAIAPARGAQLLAAARAALAAQPLRAKSKSPSAPDKKKDVKNTNFALETKASQLKSTA